MYRLRWLCSEDLRTEEQPWLAGRIGFGARTPIRVFTPWLSPFDVTLLHMYVSSCGLTWAKARSRFRIYWRVPFTWLWAPCAPAVQCSSLPSEMGTAPALVLTHGCMSVGSLGCAQLHLVVT